MALALDGKGHLHAQAYRALRAAIVHGAWTPGQRLPGGRQLASELALSRNTLSAALEQLRSEGYIAPRTRSGWYVSAQLPEDSAPEPAAPRTTPDPQRRPLQLSAAARALSEHGVGSWELPHHKGMIDFRYGEPAYREQPLETWARLLSRHVRQARSRDLSYRAPGGHPALRAALAAYLARARGVRCSPSQVIVTTGSQQALDLCARVLIDPGQRVGIEDPHYPGVRFAFAQARAELVPVPVDDEGLVCSSLQRQRLRLACVTPSHHYPTGVELTPERRSALLAWARERDSFIVEDDYDSEFRYAGRPLPSLQSLDEHERVLYVGTLSKLLFPALRIGYLVVPEPLCEAFLCAKAAVDTGAAGLEQAALAELIASGELERHARRTRLRNAARRATLHAALTAKLGARMRCPGAPAGLHMWLELPQLPAAAARAVRRGGLQRGVAVYTGDVCYLSRPRHASLVLGYANLSGVQIERGVERLAAAVAEVEAAR